MVIVAVLFHSDCTTKFTYSSLRHQLPLYTEYPLPGTNYVLEKKQKSALEDQMQPVSEALLSAKRTSCQYTDRVLKIFGTTRSHSRESWERIRNSPDELVRIGLVWLGGLSGFVFGHRGGPLRKTFYATLGFTGGALICYPKESANLAKLGWQRALQYYEQNKPSAGAQK